MNIVVEDAVRCDFQVSVLKQARVGRDYSERITLELSPMSRGIVSQEATMTWALRANGWLAVPWRN